MGSQTSGRCYTILCGNSLLVPALISKNALHDKEVLKEYPMVEFAPNLNGKQIEYVHINHTYLYNIYK